MTPAMTPPETAPTPVGVSKEHITKTPGVCGGKACIAGTRIRVMDIVYQHESGKAPADIAAVWQGVTVADVHAALAYAYDHRAELDANFEEERRVAEFGDTQPSLVRDALARDPGLLQRLRAARAGEG
jgi:uncharacterized protein (DUF433 family)